MMISFHLLREVGGSLTLLKRTWDESEVEAYRQFFPDLIVREKRISIKFDKISDLAAWATAKGIEAPCFIERNGAYVIRPMIAKSSGSKFEINNDFGIDRGKITCMASPKSFALRNVPKPKAQSASNWHRVKGLSEGKELSYAEWQKHFCSIGYSQAKAKKLAKQKAYGN